MNALNLYVNTCRIVFQADPDNQSSWLDLCKLLPYLRQSLTCTVCSKLMQDPHSPTETSCQHHVCKSCLGEKKCLKPSCSWCKDYDRYIENAQISILLKCYQKLCEFIKYSPIYKKLHNSCTQFGLLQIIDEAASVSPSILKKSNLNSVVESNNISNGDFIAKSCDVSEDEKYIPPLDEANIPPLIEFEEDSVTLSANCLSDQTNSIVHSHFINASNHSVPLNSISHDITSDIPIEINNCTNTVNSHSDVQLHNSCDKHIVLSSQESKSDLNLKITQNSCNTAVTVEPNMILTNDYLACVGNKQIMKDNNISQNNPSLYSVMYNDTDSTKITIKRKPPDLENVFASDINTVHSVNNFELPSKPKLKQKPKPKRKGCRCGNATATPGKLTCCGQRCPCYVDAKACIECRCRGCRNPHRPGGKKVRPVIPQQANIHIHPVKPVHSNRNPLNFCKTSTLFTGTQTVNTVSSTGPQTIRAIQAMHAVQAVNQIQTVPSGLHQFISRGIVENTLPQTLNVSHMAGLTMKPINIAVSSVPGHLLIDEKSSNSGSDNSDIDVDI